MHKKAPNTTGCSKCILFYRSTKSTSTKSMLDSLPKFEADLVDSLTHINVWSCGIGKSPLINFALPKIFRNTEGGTPQVYCSPFFVLFTPDETGEIVRVNASYWPYYFKRGYRPSPSIIAQELKQRYPDTDKNWQAELNDDLKTMDYHIPISHLQLYEHKEDRPDLSSEALKQQYIDSIPEVLEQLSESGIPRDRFHWRVEKRILKDSEGQSRYAVKVLGMSTVLCFIEREG